MFFNISQFKNTPAEIEKIELSFRNLGSIQEKKAAWEELDDFFYNKNSAEDRKYFFSLFRWYTELSWKMLMNLPSSMVMEIAFTRQVPTAFLLGFDVHLNIIEYLGLKAVDEAQMMLWYSGIQNDFLTSSAILGHFAGKDVTVAQAVEMIIFMQRPGATSIEVAETSAKLQDILFPKNEPLSEKYFFAEPRRTTELFIDLINFFLGVKQDRILYVVDSFMHPEKYEALDAIREKRQMGDFKVSVEPSAVPVDENEKISYRDIRAAIEASVYKDGDESTQAGLIFSSLEKLALEYNDEKIVDLYYFDETTGQFRWNNALIAP